MNEPNFIAFAHRGAMGYEPENTLRSVRKALELGAAWIEIDLYYVDGELVVFHDDRLERTTNGRGYLCEQSFSYLRSLDAGAGEQIPTLDEVCELVRNKAALNLELKGAGTAAPLAKALERYLTIGWDSNRFLVSSFNQRELLAFKELLPDIRIGVLLCGLPLDDAKIAEDLGAYSIHPSIEFIDQRFVDDAHRRGLQVYVYTVNEPEDIERMKQLGVDGVFSNYPDRVVQK